MNTLHAAFFDVERDSYRQDTDNLLPVDPTETKKLKEVDDSVRAYQEEENALQQEIGPDFSGIDDIIIQEKVWVEGYDDKKAIFEARLQSKNKKWKIYKEVRNKKIKEWFWRLISDLEGEKFFKWYGKSEKKEKIKEIEIAYRNQVKADYIENIWESSDVKFDEIKDNIFGEGTINSSKKTFYSLINQNHNGRDKADVTIHANSVEKKESDAEVISEKAKKQIKFLAHDLPNYLWEIKDPNLFQKLFSKVDAPSEEDRAEIENFIKAVDKLDWDNVEIKLMEVFGSLEKDASVDDIKNKLTEAGLSLKDEKKSKTSMTSIKKAFDFYKSTMNPQNSLRNQHAIYIDILERVRVQWWMDNTIAVYKQEVENYQERKKLEKKGKAYERWTNIWKDLKDFADALNIPVSTTDKKTKRKLDKIPIDYTSVARLNNKSPEYFENTDIVDILSDLNNDWEIRPSDKWTTKTWTQFKEIYNHVKDELASEDLVLQHLLDMANLKNNFLAEWVKISEEYFDVDTAKDEIKNGNKKLILLLQNIIANPWQDLYTLMLYWADAAKRQSDVYEALVGPKKIPEVTSEDPQNDAPEVISEDPQNVAPEVTSEDPQNAAPESVDDPRVQQAATDLLKKNGIVSDSDIDLDNVTYDWLHQAVAWALLVGYFRDANGQITMDNDGWQLADKDREFAVGAGVWTSVSFDEWVKWLSLNLWVQWAYTKDWQLKPGFWLTLSYAPEIDAWNWWSVTPWVHCWFIMLGQIPAYEVGASIATAKEWLTKNHIAAKVGWQIGVDYVITSNTLVFSAMVWWQWDKAKWIEESKDNMKEAFNSEIMTPLLEEIAKNFNENEKFDLTKTENVNRVNDAIDVIINKVLWDKKSEFKAADIKKLKENTISLLINYNNAPIRNENVRKHIAEEMSKAYASAWAEQWLDAIMNKVYVSGVRAWVSFARLVGTAYFSPAIHLGMSFKRHREDGYGDGSEAEYDLKALSGSTRDQKKIDYINKYLDDNAQFSLKEVDGIEYVVLSKEMMSKYSILFHPEMKWLMKKDDEWNILLSTKTFINLPVKKFGAATKYAYILIGWWDVEKAINGRNVNDEWFTDGLINTDKLPSKEVVFTETILNDALTRLKKSPKLEDDDVIKDFEFDIDTILPQLEKWHKYKITLERDWNRIKTPVVKEVTEWDALQIEYIGTEKVELMNPVAQKIAKDAYDEARKVKSNALYNVSHGKGRWSQYVNFANAMRNKEYQKAKDIIIKMLPDMDKEINKYQWKDIVKFEEKLKPELEKLSNDDVALWQALLSINNVFARVSSVKWGAADGAYHFKKYRNGETVNSTMGEIIEARAWEIKRKINNTKDITDDNVKESYTSLIDAMENYRKDNSEYYNATSKERITLQNAVWINLGNAINIENPLFNPEIYKDSQIKLEDLPDFNWKNTLQQHAMEVMAKDKSLVWPILKKLNIDVSEIEWNYIKYTDPSYNPETWELTVTINWKKVKFKAEMSVWYFSQCVNHMILLDNIKAEVEWQGDSVDYGPWIMWDGKIIEWTKKTIVATASVDVDVVVWLWKYGKGQQDATTHQEGGSSSWSWGWWSEQWGGTSGWSWDWWDNNWGWGSWL